MTRSAPPSSALVQAGRRYGVEPDAFRPLGAFESDVYAFDGPHGPSILKVISPEHRDAGQVRAEVDWLLALTDAHLPVAQPLPSQRGAFVEAATDPRRTLVAFRRAPGATTAPADWTEGRVEAWGALLGRLQEHARGWIAPGPRRHALARQSYLARLDRFEARDPAYVAAAREVARRAAPLFDANAPGSGLIHADLHHGNLLLHEERWTAIDFDDAAYGAFAFDLAMPLYYAVRSQRHRPAEEAAASFLVPFLRGFRRHAPDPEGGADAVALALDVRQAELVAALWTKVPEDAWTDSMRAVERDLRDRVVAGRTLLPVGTVRELLSA